ncbi:MAG: helix-hairpin-helix domain-containing protein [Atopobiaceae bacterium]|nr:helix-hairpin-helix domain-containing protein [Atopobiaceae bacterium]
MAQERKVSLGRKLRVLARRYGLVGHKAVAAAVGMLLTVIALVAATRVGGASDVELVRSSVPIEADDEAGDDNARDRGSDGDASQEKASEDDVTTQTEHTRRLVHVDGAVVSPGVYVLEEADARVNDAVTLAGGLTPEADTSQVNLAAPVEDGQKVHIPVEGEVTATAGGGMDTVALPSEASANPSGDGLAGLVNINEAAAEELCTLPGVGEATAAAIIEDREAHGPFASVDDLMRVSGIGEKKLAKMRERICV